MNHYIKCHERNVREYNASTELSRMVASWFEQFAKVQLRGAMVNKRIGILTGGGDVPGLNSVIKTVTCRSSENEIEVVGLRRAGAGDV